MLEQTHEPLAPLARGGHWATFAVTSTRPIDFAALGREMEAAARALPPGNYEFWELSFRCQAGQLDVVKAGLHRPTVRDLHPRFIFAGSSRKREAKTSALPRRLPPLWRRSRSFSKRGSQQRRLRSRCTTTIAPARSCKKVSLQSLMRSHCCECSAASRCTGATLSRPKRRFAAF